MAMHCETCDTLLEHLQRRTYEKARADRELQMFGQLPGRSVFLQPHAEKAEELYKNAIEALNAHRRFAHESV